MFTTERQKEILELVKLKGVYLSTISLKNLT